MVYLEVIYTLKTKRNLHFKQFELKEYAKAFNLWYKAYDGAIWLRETAEGYETYFDKNKAKDYFIFKEAYFYAEKEDLYKKFVEWLKKQLEIWNNGEGLELIK